MLVHEIIMIAVGLLCGSILFSRYLPKWIKKVDIVALSDDHNPGTANAMQYAGIPVGLLCLLGDIFKGVMPVHIALRLGLESGCLFSLIMAAPVLGHAFSLYHRGRGGKAIAVSFGVLIGLMPIHTEPIFALCSIYLFFSGGAHTASYPENKDHLCPAGHKFPVYALFQMDSLADLWGHADDILHCGPQKQSAKTGAGAAGRGNGKANDYIFHMNHTDKGSDFRKSDPLSVYGEFSAICTPRFA